MSDGGGLSELGVLVAQLESVVHSASQKPLQPLMCFDLLSDLLSTLDKESKVGHFSSLLLLLLPGYVVGLNLWFGFVTRVRVI